MKPSVLGLLIASGAFGVSTIYLAVQLKEERAQAEVLAAQSRKLDQRIAELEKVRAELESLRLAGGGAAMAAVSGPSKSDAVLSQSDEVVQPPDARLATESGPRLGPPGPPLRSEAMQKMVRAQIRANFKRMNSDIGSKLGLGQEDANKLIDLMVDQQMANFERARQGRNLDLTSEQRAAAYAAQQDKNLAEITALIGTDKAEAYKAYQEAMPARQEVDMLSRQLEADDLNLSKDQRDRLVTALADERQRVPAPKYSDAVSREEFNQQMMAWQEDYNQRAATRASSILTSEQQDTYSEYQRWNKEVRQQLESRRAARDGAGPGGAAQVPPR